ncbi:MAG: ABC transporter ATP-binding protein [Firmicutes bacterium]|nr:ABC transporter ATP-binding protein [Bacillota bacterium]
MSQAQYIKKNDAKIAVKEQLPTESSQLELKDMRVKFPMREGRFVHAVNGVDLVLAKGESLGVVGESGCGKSVTFSSVMRLIKSPPAIIEGEILFEGRDILKMSKREIQKIRGKDITMIFQEPMTSLNPVMRIGKQITETILLHENISEREAAIRARELFKMVDMPDAENRLWCYPHQLSGGLRQRVMIAMALACTPQILLADEPTTALDVTIQAQILELLSRLQEKTKMSIVMITHDLGIIAEITTRVAVFYAGRIVEQAPTAELFLQPAHPYTIGLLGCIPTIKTTARRLYLIEGNIPDPASLPGGCPFHPRCRFAKDICKQEEPTKREFAPQHFVACHFAEDVS